nr:hypothetical protein [Eubacterium sp.]
MKRLLSILLAAVMCFTVCTPFSACADYENPHPDWGNEINLGFITNYVADDGTVSAEITDNGITWLYTNTEGKTYYGLDNSYGTFEKGSRFWIRWVDSSETGGEPILLYAVESPEGEIHTEWFEPPISLYIQINDGWAAKEYEWTEEKVAAFAAGVSEHKNNYTIIDNYVLPDGTLSR